MDSALPSESKVWLVTGCSGGLGNAIARAVLAAGDRLVATARQPGSLASLQAMAPDRCRILTLDVTDAAQVTAAVADTVATWGRIDVLVNNAGAGLLGSVEDAGDAEVRRCLEVNFLGPLALTRAVLPHMRRQRSGHIVQVTAAAAVGNYPGFGAYGAAKAALEALSESLRAETAGLGIRVTLVEPGPFRTGFVGRSLQRSAAQGADYERTVGRFGTVLATLDGRQPGDPDRAAATLVDLVRAGRAPFRLPLGRYMVKKLRDRAADLTRTADEWESVAAGADRSATE